MILLTGGTGRLGSYIKSKINCFAPTREELDITKPMLIHSSVDLIVHCAAYTDVAKAELEKELCYETNVIGTRNIAKLDLPVIHISTDSIFDGRKGMYKEEDYPNPVNFYCLTKALAEESIITLKRHAIIRTTFRPRPFQWEEACIDKYISGDYVDVIGQHIVDFINNFYKYSNGIYHIGTRRKSVYDLAKQTRDVKPILLCEIEGVKLPQDVSLDCSKWESMK